jgi:uncharacterized membrane protein
MSTSEKPRYTELGIFLEIFSVSILSFFIVYTFLTWPSVPDKIPIHFGWSGLPNIWGEKGMLPTMIYVSVFLFILLSIVSRYPSKVIFPLGQEYDEDIARLSLQLRFTTLLWIKAEIMLITSYIGIQGIRVALEQSDGLGTYSTPIALVILLGTISIFIYRAKKLKLLI